ncbi:hypothetical protein MPDQ_000872 [Monascus purpureus]|uniref:UDP-galactose transporter n=1 Tax=Monascus purpureus TaxID=5098 RepID=A0A507R373_MONPU|nr:hypothetical protein MPDQ_000872 [Monascus purpureus]BDD55667.1 hypothetical protein MAP00_001159 [Monascus purpureus]
MPQRQRSRLGVALDRSAWFLLALHSTTFILLVHYSRVMSPAGGRRYLPSTAVFLNEVVKLAISLTMALYEVSKAVPASMPATSLFSSLVGAIFSGDSWKLVFPASLYTLSNSLQYVGLSNLPAPTFQDTYQLKLLISAISGLVLLKRSVPLRKWTVLLLLTTGVVLVQIADVGSQEVSHQDEGKHFTFPRTLEEWKAMKGAAGRLRKRSATYEGIEEDMLTIFPQFNSMIGLLATVGACVASGLAGVSFERVLKDSATPSSLWVRNVQLAVYSIFPALFIGVVLDGEKISANGFFQGYNWTVWLSIAVQVIGGIVAPFCIKHASKGLATATSIVLSTLLSIWFSEFKPTGNFLLGTAAVVPATYLYGNPSSSAGDGKLQARPRAISIKGHEKYAAVSEESLNNEFSVKLPTTPAALDAGLSTSRPSSPGHARTGSGRATSNSYFAKHA